MKGYVLHCNILSKCAFQLTAELLRKQILNDKNGSFSSPNLQISLKVVRFGTELRRETN